MTLSVLSLSAQISGELMQYPEVSDTHITFIYGDDVWIASKTGGIANRLSSPARSESFPRFSPDGKRLPILPIIMATTTFML